MKTLIALSIFAIASILLLSGCAEITPEQKAQIQQQIKDQAVPAITNAVKDQLNK